MQSVEERLDSINESVIAIPFGGSEDEADSDEEHYYHARDAFQSRLSSHSNVQMPDEGRRTLNYGSADRQVLEGAFPTRMFTPPELAHRDIPEGPFLRVVAYEHAWSKCRDQILGILGDIRKEVSVRVVEAVKEAYVAREEDRIMPYTELRALAVSGSDRGTTAALLHDVRSSLSRSLSQEPDEDESMTEEPRVRMSTIEASDCSNIASTMRALIGDFINGEDNDDSADSADKTWRLSPYDIHLLVQWYQKLQCRGSNEATKLVVFVPELEKVDPAIMQDVFYICSQYVPDIPIVFVLGLSSPPQRSYLHSAYPRATRALLQVTCFEAPAGLAVLERALLDTFFDPDYEPAIMLSAASLSFVHKHFLRTAQSMDFVLAMIQLFYLRHFTEPLSVMTMNSLLGQSNLEEAAKILTDLEANPFCLVLLARIQALNVSRECEAQVVNGASAKGKEPASTEDVSTKNSEDEILIRSPSRPLGKSNKESKSGSIPLDPSSLLSALRALDDASEDHRNRMRALRIAFRLVYTIRKHLFKAGIIHPARIKNQSQKGGEEEEETIGLMCACLKGRLNAKECRRLIEGVCKLELEAMDELLGDLMPLLKDAAGQLTGSSKSGFDDQLRGWNSRLMEQEPPDVDSSMGEDVTVMEVVQEMTEWAVEFSLKRVFDVTEGKMWDLWVTASPSSVVDLFNSAPRATIINALVHPERYLVSSSLATKSCPPSKSKSKGKKKTATWNPDPEDLHTIVPTTDTSLLFRGYLEGGRMLNVYDWYSSFRETLEGRRKGKEKVTNEEESGQDGDGENEDLRNLNKRGRGRRGRGRGTGRGRGRGGKQDSTFTRSEIENEVGADNTPSHSEDAAALARTGEEKEEGWEEEVQVRFIRSLHELDFLGFVRHTTRRAEHVLKTVFEPPEDMDG